MLIFSISLSSSNTNFDFKELKSFQAQFSQLIKSNQDQNINYTGEIFIKNDGKVLWKYKEPILKNVYINKNFVIIDEPELEQAIFTQLNDEINIVKMLSNAKKIAINSYETTLDGTDYNINVKDEKIHTISYKDKLENSVLITFKNVKNNIKIENKIFEFNAPEYYDLIRK